MQGNRELAESAAAKNKGVFMPGDAVGKESAALKGKDQDEIIRIESRFGPISVRVDSAIFFPRGLLGLPENLHFSITDLPDEKMKGFRLLQSLNDHSLSFVVLPIGVENGFIDRADMEECCRIVDLKEENLLALLIISVARSPESVKITANVRAPVIIDVAQKMALQYVFPHNKYEICHPLT